MPVLVDGHNLIGQIPTLSLGAEDDEAQLVMLLRRYATRKRGRRVLVVFDHGVYGHPQRLNGYGVECIFAHSPRDADAELIRRIRAVRRPKEWLVVSSDRAVTGEARARGVNVVSSQEFGRKLLAQNQRAPSVHEKGMDRPLSAEEIAEWLRLFGIEPDEEGEQ
jgi:predicted RNA-binding protein with PIN domain